MKKSTSFLRWPLVVLLVWVTAGIGACNKKGGTTTYGDFMIVNASPGFGPVDVYIDNNKLNTAALAYPSNTGYNTLEAGQHNMKVTAIGSTTALFEGTLNTLGDISQSLYIYGPSSSLNVFAVADNFYTPGPAKALIRFFHLSPGGQTIDLGTLSGAIFTPLYTARSFETSTTSFNNATFMPIDAGTFNFDVRVNGAGISLFTDDFTIEAGKFYTFFLKGIGGDPVNPLGIEVITHN